MPPDAMNDVSRLGRTLFIVAVWALGIQALICATAIYELEPLPAWLGGPQVVANLTGLLLVAVGTGLLIGDLARIAAMVLSAVLVIWILLLHMPLLIPNPAPDLSFAFETLALAGVAWALAGRAADSRTLDSRSNAAVGRTVSMGRYAYGVSLIAFCAVNVIYHRFIAGMIPAWIPAHLFWAYFTGFASLAAGVSILSGVWARAALILTGIMYGSWVLIIHVPYVAAHPHARDMWTDMFITLALAGGAWMLAGTLPCAAGDRGPLVP